MTLNEHWVAIGPVAGTWWCTLDDAPYELTAPGGVVLCHQDTLTPHPDVEQAAASAWAILGRWQSQGSIIPSRRQLGSPR